MGIFSAAEMAVKKPAAPPPITINFSFSSTVQALTSMRSWRKQGIYKSSRSLRLTIFQAIFYICFIPGGFGDSNNRHPRMPKKQEPSVYRAIFCMVGMLIFWLISFIGGLKLGMGWYAWPSELLFYFFSSLALIFGNFESLI